jgi:hypothetical protein
LHFDNFLISAFATQTTWSIRIVPIGNTGMNESVNNLSLSLSLCPWWKRTLPWTEFLLVNCEKMAMVINCNYSERSWCSRENSCSHLDSQHFSKFLSQSCLEQRKSFSYVPSNVISSIINVMVIPPWLHPLEFSSDGSLPCALCLWKWGGQHVKGSKISIL